MGFFSKLFGRSEETDDQKEISLYHENHAHTSINALKTSSSTGKSCFVIDDVFTITGRGTVVTGKVTEGSFSVGDTVTIDCAHSFTTVITGIEQFRKTCDTVHVGDNAGILLKGVAREQVGKGNLILK